MPSMDKNKNTPLTPREVVYDKDTHHVEYLYDFYAKDLSSAFSALRKFTSANSLTPSAITMQKFPEVETVRKKTGKLDESGNPVYSEKKKVKHSDIRWVLSFDWKTKDPAEARSLDYLFYDDGWSGSVSFIIAEGADSSDTSKDVPERKSPFLFECTLTLCDNDRAPVLSDSLASILGIYAQEEE